MDGCEEDGLVELGWPEGRVGAEEEGTVDGEPVGRLNEEEKKREGKARERREEEGERKRGKGRESER